MAAHPLSNVLTTMPGVGVRTCARILNEVVGKEFPTAGHLASYAGLAPVTRRSGTSIRGEHLPRGGNKVLKRALFLSAFAAAFASPSPIVRTAAPGCPRERNRQRLTRAAHTQRGRNISGACAEPPNG